jgi:hypothetical protein
VRTDRNSGRPGEDDLFTFETIWVKEGFSMFITRILVTNCMPILPTCRGMAAENCGPGANACFLR